MHEAIVAARVLTKFQMGNFNEMYAIFENHEFSRQIQPMLQKMWTEAHYMEAEQIRGSPLFPVDKYRLRKKHPFPRTILSEEKVYFFKEQDRKILKKYYLNDAYPNQAVRKQLAEETGFMIMRVDNWFKNRRQRDKKQQQKMSADYSPRIAEEIKAQKQIMADAKKVFEAATARLEQLEQKQQQQAQNLSPAKMPPAELEKEDEIFGPIEKKKRKETDE
ncbi:hypothetical protein niasHT_035068 [Heterodera trifolii]|uniref:Homeobox domain-containing protein n=1 Tax=Heterodera trifolii TaxID=157864 RepID=A0ABD2IMS7_9BILA